MNEKEIAWMLADAIRVYSTTVEVALDKLLRARAHCVQELDDLAKRAKADAMLEPQAVTA
jgi:uncharacterized protein YbjQ (UPF0145 family)